MTGISTRVMRDSTVFQSNAAHNKALVEDLRQKLVMVGLGGSEASRQRHLARGKFLPRDRVMRLLDPGSPFLEIGALAANGMYQDEAPAAGLIAGIGRVEGLEVMIVANDATVMGK
jgi:3-methylcrotonyl-CoA carboxylase beta subunit